MKSNNFGTTEDLDPMLKADTERARRAEARQRRNIVIVDGRRSGQGEVLPSAGFWLDLFDERSELRENELLDLLAFS